MFAHKAFATQVSSGQSRLQQCAAARVAPGCCRRSALCRPVAFQDSTQTVADAPKQHRKATTAARALRLPTIELISSAVSVQAHAQQLERFAGRSAMIGVLVAVVAELLTESSIFRHFSADTVTTLSSLFMGAVSLAAAAAFASRRRMGVDLLEAVVTSLTANQRSAASITGRQVDTAVDNILNKAFDQGVICSILAGEEDL